MSSTNKTERYDITETLLKVALHIITQTQVITIVYKDLYSQLAPADLDYN
jgi:hypothetical protein